MQYVPILAACPLSRDEYTTWERKKKIGYLTIQETTIEVC